LQHRVRRGAGRQVRVLARPGAAAAQADAGAQDQRAYVRGRPVAAHGELAGEYQHGDAASMFFVSQPERFDVIVTDNLFGDILTDLGAAIAGGIGLAASGNINPSGTSPSMFEPVHGSAPDIAGKSTADPTAAILSAAMLASHLGMSAAAAKIEQAVADDIIERQGQWQARNTVEVGDDIREPGSW